MASTNGGPPPAEANQAPPQLNVLAQYVKDLSFENPNAHDLRTARCVGGHYGRGCAGHDDLVALEGRQTAV